MNGIKFLLDTNIVIGLLKENLSVLKILEQTQCQINECAVSQITRMELLSYQKLKESEKKSIEQLLSSIEVLLCDKHVENTTIKNRKIYGRKLPDSIIIATAINCQLELLALDKQMSKQVHDLSFKANS